MCVLPVDSVVGVHLRDWVALHFLVILELLSDGSAEGHSGGGKHGGFYSFRCPCLPHLPPGVLAFILMLLSREGFRRTFPSSTMAC